MKLAMIPAAFGLLAMSAFGQSQPPTGSGGGATGGTAPGSPSTSTTPGTVGQMGTDTMSDSSSKSSKGGADAKFAMMVAQSDVAEIAVGNLALQKTSNDQVKKIAQKLVDDHTKTSESLKQIASKKGMTLPTEPDAKHKAMAKKLEAESGAQFDKDFLDGNIKDHHKVVAAFQKESTDGKDADIKGFAAQYLPAIQEHTSMMEQAKGSMSGTQ